MRPIGLSEATSDIDLLAFLLGADAEKAPALLARFRTLGHVIAADHLALDDAGVGEHPRTLFAAIREAARRLALRQFIDRPMLTMHDTMLAYLQTAMAHDPSEHSRVLFLDTKNRLIADEVMSRGTIDHAPIYPREIVKRALVWNANALILAHNHPSGDPTPSRDDIEMTRQVIAAANTLGMHVHDHLVIGSSGHVSFRAAGLLP